jgi:hypothetical protein
MSWSTGKASVRIAVLLAALAAGGALLRIRRRGEIWHTLRDRG